MILSYINNIILISHWSSLFGYQEFENWYLYREINIVWVGTKTKNSRTCGAHYSYNNQHMKDISYCIIERGINVVVLLL